jgi:hypothetical protein
MEKTVGHHVHDHPSSTPHTQLTTLHVQGGEERRRRSFASFPTEHISPACPFCLGLCPFPPRPSHSPRSALVSASPLPSCRPSRHSLALLPFTNHLVHSPPPFFAWCAGPPASCPVPLPLFLSFSHVAAVVVVTSSSSSNLAFLSCLLSLHPRSRSLCLPLSLPLLWFSPPLSCFSLPLRRSLLPLPRQHSDAKLLEVRLK